QVRIGTSAPIPEPSSQKPLEAAYGGPDAALPEQSALVLFTSKEGLRDVRRPARTRAEGGVRR
ncbi:MAG: hypothetical protein ABSD78_18385, partial [Acidimicrobiales bacterium]